MTNTSTQPMTYDQIADKHIPRSRPDLWDFDALVKDLVKWGFLLQRHPGPHQGPVRAL